MHFIETQKSMSGRNLSHDPGMLTTCAVPSQSNKKDDGLDQNMNSQVLPEAH
jgi:hypothetical protein